MIGKYFFLCMSLFENCTYLSLMLPGPTTDNKGSPDTLRSSGKLLSIFQFQCYPNTFSLFCLRPLVLLSLRSLVVLYLALLWCYSIYRHAYYGVYYCFVTAYRIFAEFWYNRYQLLIFNRSTPPLWKNPNSRMMLGICSPLVQHPQSLEYFHQGG